MTSKLEWTVAYPPFWSRLISLKLFRLLSMKFCSKKWRVYGFSKPTIGWFRSFLSDRSQCIRVGDHCSAWMPVNRGTSWLPTSLTVFLALYKWPPTSFSTDTTSMPMIYKIYNSPRRKFLMSWNAWMLTLLRFRTGPELMSWHLIPRTQSILLGSQKHLTEIHPNCMDLICLNVAPIPFSDMVKNLDVIMDQSLSGDSWVKKIYVESPFPW